MSHKLTAKWLTPSPSPPPWLNIVLWHRELKALPEPNSHIYHFFSRCHSPSLTLGQCDGIPSNFPSVPKLWVALYAAEWGLRVAGIERWDWRWPLFPLDSMSLPLTSRPFLSGPDLQLSVSGSMAKLMLFSGPASDNVTPLQRAKLCCLPGDFAQRWNDQNSHDKKMYNYCLAPTNSTGRKCNKVFFFFLSDCQ